MAFYKFFASGVMEINAPANPDPEDVIKGVATVMVNVIARRKVNDNDNANDKLDGEFKAIIPEY